MSEDFSSIDIDLLSTFLEKSGESAKSARTEIKSVSTFIEGVRERCEAGAPGEGSLGSARELVDMWDENEEWARVIRDDIGADKSGTVEFSDANITQALVDADVMEAPEVIPFEETEILGLAPTSGFADDPVCTANGNFIQSEIDLTFYGFAESLNVVRTYNSLRPTRDLFGVGWSSLLDMSIHIAESDGVATATMSDGGCAVFAAKSDGQFLFDGRRGLGLTLKDETFELKSAKRSWLFNIEGELIGGKVGGASFTVTRPSDSEIVATCDVSGRWVRLTVGSDGLVGLIESSDGRTVEYTYIDACCVRRSSSRRDRVYEIADGFVTAILDEDGVLVCRNSYDPVGKVLSQETPHGGQSRYEYAANNTTKVQYQNGEVLNAFIHDDRGNLTTLFGADGVAQRTTWDAHNRPLQIQERGGGRITFKYESSENLVSYVPGQIN